MIIIVPLTLVIAPTLNPPQLDLFYTFQTTVLTSYSDYVVDNI